MTGAQGGVKGSVKVPSAHIIEAELDTVESEISEPTASIDKFSVITSAVSAIIVAFNIWPEDNWTKDKYLSVILILSIVLAAIQVFRLIVAFISKDGRHRANAKKYLKKWRATLTKES